MPIPMKIWSQVGIDLMCLTDAEDFEEDKKGYKYIITAQCCFSKYMEIGALKMKTGVGSVCMDIWEHILSIWGDRYSCK